MSCAYTYFIINLMLLTASVTSRVVNLMQILSDFEQDIIDAVIDLWCDRLRSHVRAVGRHFKHMLWNYLSFMWFIRTFLLNFQCV